MKIKKYSAQKFLQCWATTRGSCVSCYFTRRSAIPIFFAGLRSFWAAVFHVVGHPSTCGVSLRKRFQKPPVNPEFLEFVIKPRSANHSWRPGYEGSGLFSERHPSAMPRSPQIEMARRPVTDK